MQSYSSWPITCLQLKIGIWIPFERKRCNFQIKFDQTLAQSVYLFGIGIQINLNLWISLEELQLLNEQVLNEMKNISKST